MADFAELAKGLLTLEINTVRKDGISAQKMPTAPNALIETAQAYWTFLCMKSQDFAMVGDPLPDWAFKISRSFKWGREPFPQRDGKGERPVADPQSEPLPPGYEPTFLIQPPATASYLIFDHLREIAAWIAEMQARTADLVRNPAGGTAQRMAEEGLALTGEELDLAAEAARGFLREERAVIHRIRRNSDQFKVILDRIDPTSPPSDPPVFGNRQLVITRDFDEKRFTSADLVPIRKAWDIGTEIVLMQTVVQIDGDVVNRFQAGLDPAQNEQLHAMHAKSVDISLRYWRWLADALGRLAGTAVSKLMR